LSPAASIIVLTHDRTDLLRLSVASALAQTESDIEVLILGDGVGEPTRSTANDLARADARVRFLDYPKGPHRGETNRDLAIREAQSNAIFYLCDDDLFLPRHVESLLALLESHNFVQSKNCWVAEEGRIRPCIAGLSSDETIAWHLRDDLKHNAVGITGTAHLRDFYLESGAPWTTTPAGFWPDHYQWRRLMAAQGFAGATSSRITALQFPSTVGHRAGWTEAENLVELAEWAELITRPDAEAVVEELYRVSVAYELEQMVFHYNEAGLLVQQLQGELAALTASRSWRLTAPLRRLRRINRKS
jgi:glycosyltransferase involved in cell wall biosynthesis